jgi:hypothetical protein
LTKVKWLSKKEQIQTLKKSLDQIRAKN